jgi:transposase
MGTAMTTVTVLSGPERRRRWTPTEKARIINESLVTGASVTEVARRHDLHPNLLHAWRKRSRRPQPAQAFAAVQIAAEAAPAVLPAGGLIEIEFDNGSRMRISGAVDPATLGATVAVLASSGSRR